MVNTKRLIEMARKWQKVAALGSRRITSSRNNCSEPSQMSSSMVARRGHLSVYATDGNCFMIPLAYLTENIFIKLFRISEEEFGLPGNGPITLPCDAASMEYIISLLRNRASNDVKRALLLASLPAASAPHHLPYLLKDVTNNAMFSVAFERVI